MNINFNLQNILLHLKCFSFKFTLELILPSSVAIQWDIAETQNITSEIRRTNLSGFMIADFSHFFNNFNNQTSVSCYTELNFIKNFVLNESWSNGWQETVTFYFFWLFTYWKMKSRSEIFCTEVPAKYSLLCSISTDEQGKRMGFVFGNT